jgi:hypothetical protein
MEHLAKSEIKYLEYVAIQNEFFLLATTNGKTIAKKFGPNYEDSECSDKIHSIHEKETLLLKKILLANNALYLQQCEQCICVHDSNGNNIAVWTVDDFHLAIIDVETYNGYMLILLSNGSLKVMQIFPTVPMQIVEVTDSFEFLEAKNNPVSSITVINEVSQGLNYKLAIARMTGDIDIYCLVTKTKVTTLRGASQRLPILIPSYTNDHIQQKSITDVTIPIKEQLVYHLLAIPTRKHNPLRVVYGAQSNILFADTY